MAGSVAAVAVASSASQQQAPHLPLHRMWRSLHQQTTAQQTVSSPAAVAEAEKEKKEKEVKEKLAQTKAV